LSKARRAGVPLPPPTGGTSDTRDKAAQDNRAGRQGTSRRPSAKRAQATRRALKREGRGAASPAALSRQAKTAARRRSGSARSAPDKRNAPASGQELRPAGRPPPPEAAPQADLPDALVHGDEHDVHAPHPADAEGQAPHEDEQHLQPDGDPVDDGPELLAPE